MERVEIIAGVHKGKVGFVRMETSNGVLIISEERRGVSFLNPPPTREQVVSLSDKA